MREYSDDYTKKQRREYIETTLRLDKITLDKIIREYITLKDWIEEVKNSEILKSVYTRTVKPAKRLFLLTKDLNLTLRAIRWVAQTCKNKGLSWTLETVISWYPEFLKQKRPDEDKTPQAFKDLTKGIGDEK